MADPAKLPYLLKLIDDDSEVVKKAVARELIAFGDSLNEALARLPNPVSEDQRQLIYELLEDYARLRLKEGWKSCLKIADEYEKLETAFSLLADFQNGVSYPVQLKNLLDRLAQEYLAVHPQRDVSKLASFLFQAKQLKGAATGDYYNPSNSNLVYVIEQKQGIPISLASVYMLVGARLGLRIEGCNFPGHFLARVYLQDKICLVDCSQGGRFFDAKAIFNANPQSQDVIEEVLNGKVDAEMMMLRVLHNLAEAYQKAGQTKKQELMLELIHVLNDHLS